MIDIVDQVNATHREIGDLPVASGAGRSVLLRRVYDAPVEDVWAACTDPVRLSRWLGPVEGDFRVGGAFQLKDNAGGEILRCEQPRLIKVTWVLGEGMATEIEVRLAPAGDARHSNWSVRDPHLSRLGRGHPGRLGHQRRRHRCGRRVRRPALRPAGRSPVSRDVAGEPAVAHVRRG